MRLEIEQSVNALMKVYDILLLRTLLRYGKFGCNDLSIESAKTNLTSF